MQLAVFLWDALAQIVVEILEAGRTIFFWKQRATNGSYFATLKKMP